MLKKLLLLVGLVFSASYSYSDSISPYYGYTGNAAFNGLSWSMGTVLPDPLGLDISGVIYSYKIQKETNDSVNVYVQNANALSTGYIFRELDEWKPGSLSGTQIDRAVPVIPGIPRQAWGQGSIDIQGPGAVTDANVVYMYKVNPCYDPQYDPNCPGYKQPTQSIPVLYEIDLDSLYDATKDENIELNRSNELLINDQNEEQLAKEAEEKEAEEEELKRKYRLEKAMSVSDSNAIFAESQVILQMNALANMAAATQGYYTASIPGGLYNESIVLVDSKLPENKNGLRNGLAQQLLHQNMIDSQYTSNGN
jgi:hypothetical protein